MCINKIYTDGRIPSKIGERDRDRDREAVEQKKRNEEFSALPLFSLSFSVCLLSVCRNLNGSEALMELRLSSVISHNLKDIKTNHSIFISSFWCVWLALI